MRGHTHITAAEVAAAFDYCPETGALTWKVAAGGKAAGASAGFRTHKGYRAVGFMKKTIQVHRIAWMLTHGAWPSGQVDHVNGDPTDNRIANLRDVDQSTNMQNQRRAQADNKSSGLLGVTFHKQTNKWQASITTNRRAQYLGLYATPEAAHAAYIAAKRVQHKGAQL